MQLNGREVGFKYSVRAIKMIVDFCPDRDMSKIEGALSGKYGNIIDNQAAFIVALNTAYCRSADHKDEGQTPITMDEIYDLDQETLQALFIEAAKAMQEGMQTHVETKPAPRKKASAQRVNQS